MFSEASQITTYLSMVRTDQSQILSILDETFQEMFNELSQKQLDLYQEKEFQPFIRQCKIFLFGQINCELAAAELKKTQSGSQGGVCAKTLKSGDVAWKCEDCELDPTCIICQDCFEKGNHKGHRVWLKKNVSGCCDCGDPDAWRENGFCSDHKGYEASSEVLLQQLPMFIKTSAKYVFDFVCKQIKAQCMNLMKLQKEFFEQLQIQEKRQDITNQTLFTKSLIIELFKFFEWAIETSPAFIHYITDSFGQIYFDSVKPIGTHKCCFRGFCNEQEKSEFYAKIKGYLDEMNLEEDSIDNNLSQVNQQDENSMVERKLKIAIEQKLICVCNTLDLTFQINHLLRKEDKSKIYEFYFKLFQSFKFKQLLGLSFAANFEVITIDRPDTAHNIGSIGVQILTIDEIGLMIMKVPEYRLNLLSTFEKVMANMIDSKYNETYVNSFYHLLYDLKYLCRPKTLNFIVYHTNFLEGMLEQLSKFYFTDTVEFRTAHVMFDQSVYKEGLINMDIMLTKIYKAYIKEIDPSNIERNKRLLSAFITFFQEINQRFGENTQKGFFIIPLHRVFSYYLSRLIMHNYLKDKEKYPQKKPKDLMVDIIRRYIECKPGQNVLNYIQDIITTIICPLTRQWAFIHEVYSGKWVMLGLFINQFPRLIYAVYEYYLLLIMGLFQMLIAISPQPQETINSILQTYELDPWTNTLYMNLTQKTLSIEEFKKYEKIFDVKKLKQMIHWQLRFFIQLQCVEAPFIYPLLTDIERKDPLFYQQESITKQIEFMFKKDLRRNIIHTLIQYGGRADIKDLKKSQEKIYIESKFYEEALFEVAETIKESNKKVMFKLKDQYLNWFEPYYYLNPESMAKVTESISNMHNEKSKFNEILGDYKHYYSFSTDINNLNRDAITQSVLARYLKDFIVYWSSGQYDLEIIDNQTGHECLKLLQLMLNSARQNTYNQKNFLIQVIQSNDQSLINALISLKSQGDALSQTIDIILKGIFDLDQKEFMAIGQNLGLFDDNQFQQDQENVQQKEEEQKKSKEAIKEAARLKREAIMAKFQGKRQTYILNKIQTDNQSPQQPLLRSNSSFMEKSIGQDEDTIHCSLCKEELGFEDFYSQPYGQFGYISKSKLMSHVLQQTLKLQNEIISKFEIGHFQQNHQQSNNNDEEEKKSYETESNNQNEFIQGRSIETSYLNQTYGTGGTLIKCSHYAHYKCLNEYLISNESDIRKRDVRKLIGLDFNNFQCPLCRHLSNCLIPGDTLQNYNERKLDSKDFNQLDLLQIYAGFISRIMINQNFKTQDTLLIDIKKEPLEVLGTIANFIEHRLQLIDIKGVNEYLKKSKHHVNRVQYSMILDSTYNTVKILLDSGINVRGAAFEDEDMTEQTFKELCFEKLKKLLNMNYNNLLFENDIFAFAYKILYYIYMIYQEDQEGLQQAISQVIKNSYQLVQTQSLLRLVFMINKGTVKGINKDIYGQFNINNLHYLSQLQEIQENLIRAQLPFLRKMLCLRILLTQRFTNQSLEQHDQLEKLIDQLSQIRDDQEEYLLLRSELGLQNFYYDFLIQQPQLNENPQQDQKYQNQDKAKQIQDLDMEESAFEEQKNDIINNDNNSNNLQLIEAQFSSNNIETLSNLIDRKLQSLSSLESIQKQIDDWVIFKQLGLENFQQLSKDEILDKKNYAILNMPDQLKLLDTYFTFKFISLPSDFQSLIQEYYKIKCKNCNKQPKEACICLLCGDLTCFVQKCCLDLPGMRPGEGELTFHARVCEGGMSLFVDINNGKIIFVEGDRSCIKQSPYVNKFGESYSSVSKKWDNFYLEEGTGGTLILEEYRKMFMNFTISNEIIKYRSTNDYVWRLRAI